ncbi:MAG: hybrid sensor histidine kinase/response regulator [Salinivirgaceae bacterium]|nr:hybrid sensor histidine kinase/response regulator [Salinivirgaceae bacterium]
MEKEFSILYVDDEEVNLRIFKDTFRLEYNVHTALSASEGFEILNSNTIDLILSDQRMPEMTGLEFLKKTLKTHPKPNRILVTGYADFEVIEEAINQARIYQYVQKPWSREELLKIMTSALSLYYIENVNVTQKQELLDAKQKAEASNLLITKFLQNVSHEVRTPMNAIVGFSQLLNSPDISFEKQREFINYINSSSNRLLKIIEDILEISKLETSQSKVNKREVCVSKLLREIYSKFTSEFSDKNISFILENNLSDDQSTIISDNFKLTKIVDNLLDNAFKFTSSGYIRLQLKHEFNNIVFVVEDTGIGISKEHREVIFNRFSRFEKNASDNIIGGLGLGLSISKEYAELLGGTIELMPNQENKTTFKVTIPYNLVSYNNEIINSNSL